MFIWSRRNLFPISHFSITHTRAFALHTVFGDVLKIDVLSLCNQNLSESGGTANLCSCNYLCQTFIPSSKVLAILLAASSTLWSLELQENFNQCFQNSTGDISLISIFSSCIFFSLRGISKSNPPGLFKWGPLRS